MSLINKIQLNDTQVSLVQTWLPNDSYPYAFEPNKRIVWYWQTYPNGLPIKSTTKLTEEQIQQLLKLQ